MILFGKSEKKKERKKEPAKKVEAPKVERTIEDIPIEKVPSKARYEILGQKDARTVIVKSGKWTKGKQFITWKKRDYFPDHILKETTKKGEKILNVRYLIRWNRGYSESMDAKSAIKWSQELENFLMMDMALQFRDAAITLAGLNIDKTMMMLLLLAMVFGIPIGLSYNDIFHWVPTTVVHWVSRR